MRDSVMDIIIWFDNCLFIMFDIEVLECIYVSKNKVLEFKIWFVNDK